MTRGSISGWCFPSLVWHGDHPRWAGGAPRKWWRRERVRSHSSATFVANLGTVSREEVGSGRRLTTPVEEDTCFQDLSRRVESHPSPSR